MGILFMSRSVEGGDALSGEGHTYTIPKAYRKYKDKGEISSLFHKKANTRSATSVGYVLPIP